LRQEERKIPMKIVCWGKILSALWRERERYLMKVRSSRKRYLPASTVANTTHHQPPNSKSTSSWPHFLPPPSPPFVGRRLLSRYSLHRYLRNTASMKDPLPVPDQLERQLSKCKTVRDADTYCVSRMKTAEVRK
jgi:hypothetical protein